MRLAISTRAVLPSVGRKTSAPRTCLTPLHASPLRVRPRGHPRITRGRCGSLNLHRDGLPPSTSCRSPGAPVHTWAHSDHRRCRGCRVRTPHLLASGFSYTSRDFFRAVSSVKTGLALTISRSRCRWKASSGFSTAPARVGDRWARRSNIITTRKGCRIRSTRAGSYLYRAPERFSLTTLLAFCLEFDERARWLGNGLLLHYDAGAVEPYSEAEPAAHAY
jgi:hypothetical protein